MIIIVIELMFLGVNMFLALLRTHFKMSLSRVKNIFTPANNNSIVILYYIILYYIILYYIILYYIILYYIILYYIILYYIILYYINNGN